MQSVQVSFHSIDANHAPTIHDVCFPRIHEMGMNHSLHVIPWGCQGTLLYSLSAVVALSRHVEHNPLCKIKWLATAPNTLSWSLA